MDGVRLAPGVVVRPEELRWRFSRAGGPGGQGVNTTDSRVELSFDAAATRSLTTTQRERALAALAGRLVDGVLTVVAAEQRSQLQNRRAALDRLGAQLAGAIAPPPRARRATRPTRGSVRRRAEAKQRRSETKKLRRPPTG